MLQLLDPPLRLPDRVRLLADDLVAETQVVGQWRGVLTHAKIVRPRMLSKRPLIADFRRSLGSTVAAAGRLPRSTPSRIIIRSAALTSTPFDSFAVDAAGKRKPPLSKRLYHRQYPSLSHQRTLIRSPRRLRKTNRCPDSGSSVRDDSTRLASESNPFRMSVAPEQRKIRTVGGQLSMSDPPARRGCHRGSGDRIRWGPA